MGNRSGVERRHLWSVDPAPGARIGPLPLLAVSAFRRNRVHLLLAAVAMSWAWQPWHGVGFPLTRLVPVWLCGFGIYQLNRVFDQVEDAINAPDEYLEAVRNESVLVAMSTVSFVLAIGLSLAQGNPVATGVLAAGIVLGVAYSRPTTVSGGSSVRLKQLPLVKNLVPSTVWPILTIVYPILLSGLDPSMPDLVASVLATSAGVFVTEVAWDIRDIEGDRHAGVSTIPVRFGVDAAAGACFTAAALVAVSLGVASRLDVIGPRWMGPAVALVGFGALVVVRRNELAGNRTWSHVLVFCAAASLAGIGVLGRL